MVTLRDVARLAEVSIATVSHVLNDTKPISAEVRERVLKAVEKLGYRRNRSARTLRTGQSHSFGLILPDLINPYFPQLAQSVSNKAHSLGYAVLLVDTGGCPKSEKEAFELLAEHRVDGAIWIPIDQENYYPTSFPLVVVDRPLNGYDRVLADHSLGGKLIADYLISQGHVCVGLLSGPQSLSSARLRRQGFLDAKQTLDIIWEHEVPFSIELPSEILITLAKRNVSVIIAPSDIVAIGIIHQLGELGLMVPDDVSVIGFDDIPLASMIRPQLTTIKQPLELLGERAVEVLIKRIKVQKHPQISEVLPVQLVERNTVANLRGRVIHDINSG